MLTTVRVLALLLIASAPVDLTAQPADKPALRSSVPSHVEPPRDQAASRPPKVQRASAPAKDTEKIDINSADVKRLMTLPGVSRKIAERIVAYRDAHGPFKKPNELRKVDGVDDDVWEKSKSRIAVR